MKSTLTPILTMARLFPRRARNHEVARLSPRMRADVGLPPKDATDLPKLFWL